MFGAKAQIAARSGLRVTIHLPTSASIWRRFLESVKAPITDATPRLLEWRDRMTERPAAMPVVSAMANWLRAAARPVPAFMRLAGSR